MKSKTAVQFLSDKINFGLQLWIESKITDEEFFKGLNDAHHDALEIEYDQIIDTHKWSNFFTSGAEYYNRTFKNTDDETI